MIDPWFNSVLQAVESSISRDTAEFLAEGITAPAVGLVTLGTGIAERGIGTAAMGAIAEDQDLVGIGLILTVVPRRW